MEFKEWLKLDELNKGLKRQFRQQNPHVPAYVAKDIFHQRLGNMWRNSAPQTTSNQNPYADTIAYQPDDGRYDSVSSMMDDEKISSITNAQWEQKPKVIEASPANFDQKTLDLMLFIRFGFRHFGGTDSERHARAKEKMQKFGEKNEPIIILQMPDGKLQLQEGWHRIMPYLLQGAPPEDVEVLKNGDFATRPQIDFSRWKPSRFRAYVGYPNQQANQQTNQQAGAAAM